MSAKFMFSISDENPDLQKQIGCMSGFFQLFDRHRYLAGGRVNSHAQKRLPPPGMCVYIHTYIYIYIYAYVCVCVFMYTYVPQLYDHYW